MRTLPTLLVSMLAISLGAGCPSPWEDEGFVELQPGEGEDWSAPEDDGPSDPEFPDEAAPRDHLVRLLGAGDIASCSSSGDGATAAILDGADAYGTVFTAGDNVYPDGTTQQFEACYDPTWGRHKSRTRPAPGNHDYHTSGAAAYYDYFGSQAGPAGKGWYSYRLGEWLVLALNSNCDDVGCDEGSEQYEWLADTLAANPTLCAVAYMHHPLYSSGPHGANPEVRPLWELLHEHGVDIVVSGHDHDYERFAKQDPWGTRDDVHGVRQFVVGTGGKGLYAMNAPEPNSLKRSNTTHGVLRLTLYPTKYYFKFVPAAGGSFTDQGYRNCY
jgi:hypothetical protein